MADETVKVAVVGTGDGGIQPGMVPTPGVGPNILISVIKPIFAVLIRLANNYATALAGLLVVGMTSDVIPYADFVELVKTSAQLSIAPAGVAFLKDCITIFGKLEHKYPLATGSI